MRKTFYLTVTAALTMAFAGIASAQTHWDAAHPRRAEINHRLANQDRRIHQEVREGELSRPKAMQLHREDRRIRQEERDMARQDGGYITKAEQPVLNQQENHVSRQIGN